MDGVSSLEMRISLLGHDGCVGEVWQTVGVEWWNEGDVSDVVEWLTWVSTADMTKRWTRPVKRPEERK